MSNDYIELKDLVITIQKYVRKTNICGGDVADIVDSKKDLTQYYLEIFADNELIYVREEQAIYKVCSREKVVSKSELEKLRKKEIEEREELREKNKNKQNKERGDR